MDNAEQVFDYEFDFKESQPINAGDLIELNDAMGIDSEEKEQFSITNDQLAEWALGKIRDAQIERDRLTALADSEIQRITERRDKAVKDYENSTAYLISQLSAYFNTVPHKETKAKTKETYTLLSGVLIQKNEKPKMIPDKPALIKHLKSYGDGANFIKIKEDVDWAEFKKELEIVGEKVVDSKTGEVINCVSITEPSSQFTVELR